MSADEVTDEEVNAFALACWGPSVSYDREKLRADLAAFRRRNASPATLSKLRGIRHVLDTRTKVTSGRDKGKHSGANPDTVIMVLKVLQEVIDELTGEAGPKPSYPSERSVDAPFTEVPINDSEGRRADHYRGRGGW